MLTYEQQKRIIDLILGGALAIAFIPFWIVMPILIIIDSGWPVIYKHKRIGKNGKDFYLFKFRSMVHNADDILHKQDKELLKKFKQGDWKVEAKDDPRITKLGRIMRSLTIDEFPQIYNVLKGEMSMIGPRAYLREELEEQLKKYPETEQYISEILSVKPGITGPWQTSGRNEIPFAKRAQMDAEYARNHSIKNDVAIILRTPRAMLSKW